jgi:hypothetical protein
VTLFTDNRTTQIWQNVGDAGYRVDVRHDRHVRLGHNHLSLLLLGLPTLEENGGFPTGTQSYIWIVFSSYIVPQLTVFVMLRNFDRLSSRFLL